eukprot:177857_1
MQRKLYQTWLCLEIIIDFIIITWSIVLLTEIQDEFYDVLNLGADVYVANDEDYFGPIQILCIHSQHNSVQHNCENALSAQSSLTPAQYYFSLKYLEVFRHNVPITVSGIIESRHNLFIVLSIYVVISFCLGCAGKLQGNRSHSGAAHVSYYICISYLENSLATFKMMMINIFAVSEGVDGILLMEYIPGFSLIVFIATSVFVGCCLGAMQEFYWKYRWMKGACVCTVICVVFGYLVMFIFPSFGLNVYALQFQFQFKAVSTGILSDAFVKNVNLLKHFAFYMGFMGWIKTITPLLAMSFEKHKSDQLLDGSAKPIYTPSVSIQ